MEADRINSELKELLHEMLRDYNMEDSIVSTSYDKETNEFIVTFEPHIEGETVSLGIY